MTTENEDWIARLPKPIHDWEMIRYSNLYYLPDYPLTAHATLTVEGILEKMLLEHERDWKELGNPGPCPFRTGLVAAISYFRVMGDAVSEQEHQDAFCTPIIEVP